MNRQSKISPYDSERGRAWRNLMVCVINAALDRGLASLDCRESEDQPKEVRFEFALPNGLRSVGYVDARGFGELAFSVSVNPTAGHVPSMEGHLKRCDANASGWLERRDGKWIQCPNGKHGHIRCRRPYLRQLAEFDVEPDGYEDRGEFKF